MNLAIWNMQGGNNYDQAAALLINDYVCLQECGTPPAGWGIVLPPGAGNGLYVGPFTRTINHEPVNFMSTYYRWANLGPNPNYRCSQLLVSRTWTVTPPLVVPDPAGANARPVVGREVAASRWVFTVHSPSMGTNPAHLIQIQNQMDAVAAAVAAAVPAAKWVVAGDFNYDATNAAIAALYGNRIVRGPHATQQAGGTLDYAITGPTPGNAPAVMQWTGSGQVSDHYAQYFALTW